MCVCVCVCIYIYIYIYRRRARPGLWAGVLGWAGAGGWAGARGQACRVIRLSFVNSFSRSLMSFFFFLFFPFGLACKPALQAKTCGKQRMPIQ